MRNAVKKTGLPVQRMCLCELKWVIYIVEHRAPLHGVEFNTWVEAVEYLYAG